MGDHRASIKIEAEFHGVKKDCDMWINYSGHSSEVEGVDSRIIEFFQELYYDGMYVYNEDMREFKKQQNILKEKEQLKRLREKYPND